VLYGSGAVGVIVFCRIVCDRIPVIQFYHLTDVFALVIEGTVFSILTHSSKNLYQTNPPDLGECLATRK